MTGGKACWEMKRKIKVGQMYSRYCSCRCAVRIPCLIESGGNKVSRDADMVARDAIRMRAYERTSASELMHSELASSANARLNDTPIQTR